MRHLAPLRSLASLAPLASLGLVAACASSSPHAAAPAPATATAAAAHGPGLHIKLTTIYVDDQDKALRFYTDVLGFAKKTDIRNGPYRWLTVTAPDEPDGSQLQLALAADPAAKAYQAALHDAHQPAAMFFTGDIKGDAARLTAHGAIFVMPPTAVTGSTIAQLDDTCGNLIQLTQLD